ncbi:MAG: hypothetical protein UW45_C0027G0009 [Parcubacteria group bacterium GW2011_GWC2_44_22]|nr:MAG: hypothetical protein UW45_C0027G0009 [Parcubacteria group bacterium GW2011_GWC2_44_22]
MRYALAATQKNMDGQNLKKNKEYSTAALFSSILSLVFGFGFGFVNIAFFLIAITLAIISLVKNKENNKNVKTKCIWAIMIVFITMVLSFVGFHGLINFIINASSLQKVDELTKSLFK